MEEMKKEEIQMEVKQADNLENEKEQLISTWGYVGIILLLGIPVIGPIFAIVWACGGCKKKSKTNYARAALILGTINLIFGILIGLAVKSVVDGVMEKTEAFSVLGQNIENVEALLGDDASIPENLEELAELENMEELGALESLLGSEGLDSLEDLADMGSLLGVENLDDLEKVIGSENMDSLESMIDMDNLGDLQNIDESDIMGIINDLDEDDLENIAQMLETLGQSVE